MCKYFSSLLFSLLIVTFFTQCSEEIYEPVVGTHFSPQNKKFTYSDFLKETNANDFSLYQKYRISKSKNGVLQRNIETEFMTDTTEIKKYVDHELEKTTYTFKLYPFYEELASKEYYNLVVEKYGDQLSFIIFFNKEKLNFEEDEIPLDFSQMVYHSRSPHQGFEEVITWKYHCTNTGKCASGVCDMCNLCKSYTVSYVYVGSQPVNQEITPSEPISGGGSGGYNGGVYIPNPYDGLNDLSNPMMILAGQINEFLNSLATPLKNAATSSGFYELTHAYFLQMGLNGHSQQHYTSSLSNYLSIISGLNMNQLSFDAQQKFRFWCFTTLLHNNFGNSNLTKINTIVDLLNSSNVNSLTKGKLIDKLYNNNSQDSIDEISEICHLSNFHQNQSDVDGIINMTLILNDNFNDFLVNESALTELGNYMSLDFNTLPPGIQPILVFKIYHNYRTLRNLNPEWSKSKCLYYASNEVIHVALDSFGLVPIFGEVADITNGVLYVIEGDGLNATLSFASAVPFVGYGANITKYSLKIIEASNIGSKVKLVWKVTSQGIDFGSRSTLRKVLGITANNVQAHHIIPWEFRNNPIVQKAAHSSNAFHMNEALNGIPLPSTNHLTGHNLYNNKIQNIFNNLSQNYPNMTSSQAYNHLASLTTQIKNHITNHPSYNLGQIANLIQYP